jgi:site-specific recombinase XerD
VFPVSDYSREALLAFIDYASEKGLTNKNTAASRKVSVSAMLGILDEQEARDLRNLDVEQLVKRFHNLYPTKYSPESLRVYRSRLNSTLEEFLRYRDSPMSFKSGAPAKVSKSAVRKLPKKVVTSNLPAVMPVPIPDVSSSSRTTINVPVPLQGSCVVTIHGLPVDLTEQEAKRIANVVMALASSSD